MQRHIIFLALTDALLFSTACSDSFEVLELETD
jgi:hypothetical protein